MTTNMTKLLRFLSIALCAVFLLSSPADADQLDDLRVSGAIIERFDGFLEVRQSSADAKSVVKSVNAKRRQIYEQRAVSEGTTVDQVGQVFAAKIYGQAPAGTMFLQKDGSTTTK